jgi:hypothetical protein
LNAQFQLANAYFGSGNLAAARVEFVKLQQTNTNSPQAAFSLEEIAWLQHDTNEAIRNIQIYLAHAPTNTPQAQALLKRLSGLKPVATGK